MTVQIDMGLDDHRQPAALDLAELLATRLLVQGNSGSGKSHLLRRLLEESAPHVQQVVIDPEGDFATLSDRFGHLVVETVDYGSGEILAIAQRARAHRLSIVLNLDGLEADAQLRCAATFLNGLFDAPREQWLPVLVVVDEAQLFAPAGGGEVGEEARRASLSAMTNLMCRGRKPGLAGVIATQRLAKLAKNVAAEASNFMMGRTFLDIDMARAADLLGMERRQAEQIRDLERGQFLALGPAICRRPRLVRIGAVATGSHATGAALAPLPTRTGEDARALLFDALEPARLAPAPRAAPVPLAELFARDDKPALAASATEAARLAPDQVDEILGAMVADDGAADRPIAARYSDFALRCRLAGASDAALDLPTFTRRITMAEAGLFSPAETDPEWQHAMRIAGDLPDDLLGVFLRIARAARDGRPCPTDEDLAAAYGTASLGRLRRLLGFMETRGAVTFATDYSGRRTATLPLLGWSTAPADDAAPRSARA
ncbi:hypothetical protein GGR88_001580 [Sphingomonas jejuensis]|uniref:AAA+ ATPase domain-containing protein n=1 Tax=Sphingomonas jejuensis TaxID=904715 RepID=A0ABX0XL66_9SPHN|nr:ATP-binding protein [Sphingomonas jejuensis]NJC34106.1 hypothetical protein [Sphingomonas jejuensis]